MTDRDIIELCDKTLAEEFELDPAALKPETRFFEDLELDSLDLDDRVVMADGALEFIVSAKLGPDLFEIKAQNDGIITSRKGLALPGKAIKLPALTEKDRQDLADGLAIGVDAVALSYVQTPEDILEAKAIIRKHGRNVPVVARTPTTPLRVAAAAGLTAGSMPTIGQCG